MTRKGSAGDVPFMRSMLAHAYAWRVNAFEAEIPLSRYVDNWGRPGDLAVIAHETGNRVGAAWLRVFRQSEPGYGFVDENTPELSIAVVPSRRRHGLGQELMDALLAAARAAGHGIGPLRDLDPPVDDRRRAHQSRRLSMTTPPSCSRTCVKPLRS